MAEPFLAEIKIMSFNFAPKGWALCNGQLLAINQNQALFSLLGTNYGGDGRVNFALPDMRGRTPIKNGDVHGLGERGGEQAHTLTISEMPSHTHPMKASSAAATETSPFNNTLANAKPASQYIKQQVNLVNLAPATVTNNGGSQAHLNMQPFLTLSFCIALTGIFPSQN